MIGPHPLVSIIIPNYNYARTLALCLAGALEQTYTRLEIIVVDDGSTDDSVAIARHHPVRLIQTRNQGVSAARNVGARAAAGEILFFLDSDIALEPDAVVQAVALLSADPGVGCVCGVYACEPLIDDGPVERYKVLQGHFWRIRCAGTVKAGFFSLGAIWREVFERVGPFDESLRYTEDVEYGARLSQVARIELTPLVAGRHDDDDELGLLLRKQFTRSIPLVSLFMQRSRSRPQLSDTAFRPAAVAATGLAAAALVALPLTPALAGVPALVVPLTVLAAAGGLFWYQERELLGFVLARTGARFTVVFATVHVLMNLATGAAAAVGVARLVSPRFRRLYLGTGTTATGVSNG